jgi:predicted AAA+ superfamily ATPase
VSPRYWTEAPHEVDFIIQCENDIIPVETKAGEAVKATGLKHYLKDYEAETPIAIRLSMKNLSYDGKILNIPLFMIDELKRLIMTIERS